MAFDRQRDIIYAKGPRASFTHPGFVAHRPNDAEDRWQPVEDAAAKTYPLLHSRGALADPVAVSTLKDLIALHWARSPATRAMHELIRVQVAADRREAWSWQPELLADLYRARMGLHPTGLGALEWINDHLNRIPADVAEQWFSERNALHLDFARKHFGPHALQIAYAPADAEFLIGDTPVITWTQGRAGLGPHQGVALGDAAGVVMPVAPRVMIGLGPEPLEVDLTREQVDAFNVLQQRSFIRYLGCRPGGPGDRELHSMFQPRTVLPLLPSRAGR